MYTTLKKTHFVVPAKRLGHTERVLAVLRHLLPQIDLELVQGWEGAGRTSTVGAAPQSEGDSPDRASLDAAEPPARSQSESEARANVRDAEMLVQVRVLSRK